MPIDVLIMEIGKLMFPLVSGMTGITVPFVLYLLKYKIPKYELKKGRLVKTPKRIKLPPHIVQKARAMSSGELYDVVENESVVLFHDRLNQTLSAEQRIIMNNNLRGLEIRETLKTRFQKLLLENGIDPFVKKTNVKSGSYRASSNSIIIRDARSKSTIFHELMHMASTVKTDEIAYVGFKQRMNGEMIGQGINEGYTQHLTEKFFPEYKSTTTISYPFETHFAGLVEEIVTEDTMIDMFFRADLRDLIIELSKYSTIKDAGNFIRQMDVLNKYKYTELRFVDVQPELQEIIYELNEFLVNTYKNKLRVTRGLSPRERDMKLIEFISKIESGYIYTRKKYDAFPKQNIRR